MMTIEIDHLTTYEYSEPVFLEPHHFYFHPAMREHIVFKSFDIEVSPSYEGLTQRIDAENNLYHQVWFSELQRQLKIRTKIKVGIEEINPYYFLQEHKHSSFDQKILNLYLDKTPISDTLNQWIQDQFSTYGPDTLTIINGFNSELYQNWDHSKRYAQGVLSPDVCFDHKTGSCRDICWLMINALRTVNIPARFVSGYAFNPSLEEGHELHSWVEAWIDGAGWVGFDPVSGLLTNHFYIPVAASYTPELTLPVQGSFRGETTSTLHTAVTIALK